MKVRPDRYFVPANKFVDQKNVAMRKALLAKRKAGGGGKK